MTQRAVITLLTDFGLADEYVASMKGCILTILSDAHIIDISHQVTPGDIHNGSYLLQRAFPFFPENTVHIAVVDPGVGTNRNILAVRSEKQFFIGPDNGLLSPLLRKAGCKVYAVENEELYGPGRSKTFHGRDIMAPVAAHLAKGVDIVETGPQIEHDDCVLLQKPTYRKEGETITGRIIHIDRFGNLCTNIPAKVVEELQKGGNIITTLGTHTIPGLNHTYGSVESGGLLCHFDSHNAFEISVSGGSAADVTGAVIGDEVIITTVLSPFTSTA